MSMRLEKASNGLRLGGGRFPSERGLLAELDSLATPQTWSAFWQDLTAAIRSVVLTDLVSRWRRGGRTEFCDFLVCPDFSLKRRRF